MIEISVFRDDGKASVDFYANLATSDYAQEEKFTRYELRLLKVICESAKSHFITKVEHIISKNLESGLSCFHFNAAKMINSLANMEEFNKSLPKKFSQSFGLSKSDANNLGIDIKCFHKETFHPNFDESFFDASFEDGIVTIDIFNDEGQLSYLQRYKIAEAVASIYFRKMSYISCKRENALEFQEALDRATIESSTQLQDKMRNADSKEEASALGFVYAMRTSPSDFIHPLLNNDIKGVRLSREKSFSQTISLSNELKGMLESLIEGQFKHSEFGYGLDYITNGSAIDIGDAPFYVRAIYLIHSYLNCLAEQQDVLFIEDPYFGLNDKQANLLSKILCSMEIYNVKIITSSAK